MNRLVYALSEPVAESSSDTADLLAQIVARTNNDVIFFTIVLVIGLMLVFIPIYRMLAKNRKDDRIAEANERKELMDVIERNTGAFTSLKATIEFNNDTVTRLLTHIATKSSNVENIVTDIYDHQIKLIDTLDKVNGTVTLVGDEMKEKQRQILEKAINMRADLSHMDSVNTESNEEMHELITKLMDLANDYNKNEKNNSEK